MTDPIADMLIRIKNAQASKKNEAAVPLSKLKMEILKILKKEGYIVDFKAETNEREIVIKLKYIKDSPAITGVRRISKPGRRIYASAKELSRILSHVGIGIISTPKGILTDQQARKEKIGGEIICEVW